MASSAEEIRSSTELLASRISGAAERIVTDAAGAASMIAANFQQSNDEMRRSSDEIAAAISAVAQRLTG
jgi:hypothetical protein